MHPHGRANSTGRSRSFRVESSSNVIERRSDPPPRCPLLRLPHAPRMIREVHGARRRLKLVRVQTDVVQPRPVEPRMVCGCSCSLTVGHWAPFCGRSSSPCSRSRSRRARPWLSRSCSGLRSWSPASGTFSASAAAVREDCAAVGMNQDRPFYASQVAGVWGPGITIANPPGGAGVFSGVSCAAVGECTAVGHAANGDMLYLTQSNGTWGSLGSDRLARRRQRDPRRELRHAPRLHRGRTRRQCSAGRRDQDQRRSGVPSRSSPPGWGAPSCTASAAPTRASATPSGSSEGRASCASRATARSRPSSPAERGARSDTRSVAWAKP